MRPVHVACGAGVGAVLLAGFMLVRSPCSSAATKAPGSDPSVAEVTESASSAAVNDDPRAAPRGAALEVESAASDVPFGEQGQDAKTDEADEPAPLRTPDTLLAALASSDPFVVLDAADGLAARKVVRAIPALAAIDITKSPDSAPSIIHALGSLAGAGDPTGQRSATDRLIALLAQEKARPSPEASGNVLNIYEALAKTGDPRAATALEAELADPNVTIPAKTLAVDSLAELGQPTSRRPIEGLRDTLPSIPADDDFEKELRSDLGKAIDKALARLP